MIDIKPFVAEKLGGIAETALSYPQTEKVTPLIVVSETENTSQLNICGSEILSAVTLQLDVYADTAEAAESTAAQVSGIMISLGFRRSYSALFTDGRKPRRCMRFRAGIDSAGGRIYTV